MRRWAEREKGHEKNSAFRVSQPPLTPAYVRLLPPTYLVSRKQACTILLLLLLVLNDKHFILPFVQLLTTSSSNGINRLRSRYKHMDSISLPNSLRNHHYAVVVKVIHRYALKSCISPQRNRCSNSQCTGLYTFSTDLPCPHWWIDRNFP